MRYPSDRGAGLLAVAAAARDKRSMRFYAFLLVAPLTGCMVTDEDSLGRFELEASRSESCGDQGLLASSPVIERVVHLRKGSSTTIQWDDGSELLLLELDPDGVTFRSGRAVVVDMRAGDEDAASKPPCQVGRVDLLQGVLEEGSVRGEYQGFDVSMSYDFTPMEGSSCDDLLGAPEGVIEALPCAIGYEGHADRVE